ncbi:hypothetical protein HY484_04500 [Candidatus Woesearchaeota archaeon]|nr:hypothetical protein [Candidatus Woesearchaeota archaeon]
MSVDKLFEDFKNELQQKGYQLQETNPENELYKKGTRFAYQIPEHLWMDLRVTAQRGKEPTTQVFTKINPELIKHVGQFYKDAREAAKETGKTVQYTEPTSATSGVMVIYVGLKHD